MKKTTIIFGVVGQCGDGVMMILIEALKRNLHTICVEITDNHKNFSRFLLRGDEWYFEFKGHRYTGPFPDIAQKLGSFQPGTLGVIQRRIKYIVQGNRKFFRESGSCIPEILKFLHDNKVVLIDIPRMGERSELFVLSMITRRIMQAHRKSSEDFGVESEPAEQKKVLITIEEAQRVLGAGGSSTQIFRECAMEGRKFGVGLCVITQQPKNVDPKVLAQINTFVVMGLGDRGDREIIMGSAKQDLSKMEIEIQTLDQGEAILSTIGIPFPVSTRIHEYEAYIAELNKEKKNGHPRRTRHRVLTGNNFTAFKRDPGKQEITVSRGRCI